MKGFTLVEMLVALLVFSLLSAAGVAVLGFAADNRAVVRERMDEIAALQSARALIKTDLEQVADRRTRADGGAPGRSLTGGESAAAPVLAFTRRGWDNPDAAPRASLQYVEYRLVEDRLERRARRWCRRPRSKNRAFCSGSRRFCRRRSTKAWSAYFRTPTPSRCG